MYIVYEQKQRSNPIITSIYLLIFIILLLVVINPSFLGKPALPTISRIVLIIVLLVDIVFFRSLYELKFRVTNEGLEFGYGVLKNKFSKNNIESVLIDNSKGKFFGYGIRFSKDKTMGFISKHGPGLRIVLKDGRAFFVTMNSPEEALEIIKEHNYV